MIEKILVGTGAGDDSRATLDMAAELATTHDAELSCCGSSPSLTPRQVFDPKGVPEDTNPTDRLRSDYPGLRVRTSEMRGHALRTVCDVAEDERPDLIVVGHGRLRAGTASCRFAPWFTQASVRSRSAVERKDWR